MLAEYSYVEDIEETREEAIDQTFRVMQYLYDHPNDTDTVVAQKCNCSIHEVTKIRKKAESLHKMKNRNPELMLRR